MEAATIADFATAAGTLALAVVTVVSIRSANRSARVAERSLLAQNRPLLLPSRMQDPEQKIGFMDDHWVRLEGGRGAAELDGDVVYLTMSLRNAGSGLALLHGWNPVEDRNEDPARPEDFRQLTRDLYIAGGDIGFWQAAVRDGDDPVGDGLRRKIKERERIIVDLLYGDQEGAQRVISRLTLNAIGDSDRWLVASARTWYPDGHAPR